MKTRKWLNINMDLREYEVDCKTEESLMELAQDCVLRWTSVLAVCVLLRELVN